MLSEADALESADVEAVAKYARERAREGNGSRDQEVGDKASAILLALAEAKVPDAAVLVIGREDARS
jgi:hypothetical protein